MAVLELNTLAPIKEKVLAGERLDFDDGVALMESDDLLALGELADLARRQRGLGDEVYFVQNINLYQTNVCRVKCKFCAFAKTQKQEDAFTLTADEFVADAVSQHELLGFTEIHTVNGENPHVGIEYYAELLRKLKQALPDVHLKFYTASEIHHISKLEGCSHEEVLRTLKDAGLDSMPGGGAEIFSDRVRQLVAPGKEHPDEWFHVHDTAHRMGITTQCTMLYGHVETYEERVNHLLRLREQQDATGGFLSFIPLAFHPENTVFERRGFRFTTGADDLKVIAVARLLLDNIPHVKAYWIMMGLPLAQVALHFGADDVQGTVVREKIFQAAGATAGTEQKVAELVRVVREAGRIPVQRDSLYNEIRRWWGVREAIESRSLDDFADALTEDVVWIGLWPGEICRNRDDVLEMLARMREREVQLRPRVVLDKDDAIVVDPGLDGRHHVLILRDGLVSEVRVYPDRRSAVAAIEERPW